MSIFSALGFVFRRRQMPTVGGGEHPPPKRLVGLPKVKVSHPLKYVVALPFLISEWSVFLQSAHRFKSYDRFRKEGRTPIS